MSDHDPSFDSAVLEARRSRREQCREAHLVQTNENCKPNSLSAEFGRDREPNLGIEFRGLGVQTASPASRKEQYLLESPCYDARYPSDVS
jgi:hypothetical protein